MFRLISSSLFYAFSLDTLQPLCQRSSFLSIFQFHWADKCQSFITASLLSWIWQYSLPLHSHRDTVSFRVWTMIRLDILWESAPMLCIQRCLHCQIFVFTSVTPLAASLSSYLISQHSKWQDGKCVKSTRSILLQISLNTDHQEVWESVVSQNFETLVKGWKEGMEKVLKENYVFLASHVYLFTELGRDCRYYIIRRPQFSAVNSFALRKGSPLVPVLNNM